MARIYERKTLNKSETFYEAKTQKNKGAGGNSEDDASCFPPFFLNRKTSSADGPGTFNRKLSNEVIMWKIVRNKEKICIAKNG